MRGDRRRIALTEDIAALVDKVVNALLAADAGIYQRAGCLVRVIRDRAEKRGGLRRSAGTPVIRPIPCDALREDIDRVVELVRYDARTRSERRTLIPEWVSRTVVARGSWPFPYLEGVIESPTLTPDGEVLSAEGFGTGLLLIPSREFPRIPSDPTARDIRNAVELLAEPFHDFPFLAPSDYAAVIAAIFSLIARYAVSGCVPLFAIRSPAPATGKGLLVDAIALVGVGRAPARTTLPSDETELRKVILAVALDGSLCVLLDNVDRPVGSATLAAALTATEWEDRLLGQSARARAPLRAVWITTGNNVTFKGDLGRRVVPIDLDARVEHPEDRSGFRHPDLIAWIGERRGDLVGAGLTILRAFHVAGRPPHGCGPRKGSFERWDDLIRGACVWAGIGDPLAGAERIRREHDNDLAALRVALAAWREVFGDAAKTVAEAVSEALARAESTYGRDPCPRDALLGLAPRDRLDARALAYSLRKVKGRICGGLWFETAGERSAGMRWRVRGEMEMVEILPTYAGANGRTEVADRGRISTILTSPQESVEADATDPLDTRVSRPAPGAEPRSPSDAVSRAARALDALIAPAENRDG